MFERTKIGTLLTWGFGTVIALLAIMGTAIFQKSNVAADRASYIADDTYPKIAATEAIRFNIMRNWANTLVLASLPDGENTKQIAEEMSVNSKAITEKFEYLEKAVQSEGGKKALAAALTARRAYTESRKQYVDLLKAGDRDQAMTLMRTRLKAEVEAYAGTLQGLLDYQAVRMENSAQAVISEVASLQAITLGASGLALAIAVAAALIVSGAVRRILGGDAHYAGEIAREIARGNLGVEVRTASGDASSLLASMKIMQANLQEMVAKIQASAGEVGQAASQLSQASQAVADASSRQSTATSATAAAVEEMTVGIDQITRNAHEARGLSRQAENLSSEGKAVINRAAIEMEEIAGSVQSSSEIIGALEEQSKEISAIVRVIKDIADQTNLLALNAAIEAARAGEQGRGFAVVADEVRKLAERTSLSTQEIASTIARIQNGTQEAVRSMVAGVEQVRSGTSLAQQAGHSINDIQTGSHHVLNVVNDISDSLREQSVASNEIARNVENIARMVEANNASAEQVAAGSLQLQRLAEDLSGSVRAFRL